MSVRAPENQSATAVRVVKMETVDPIQRRIPFLKKLILKVMQFLKKLIPHLMMNIEVL